MSKAVFRITQVCTCGVTSLTNIRPRRTALAKQPDLSAWTQISSFRDLSEKGWSEENVLSPAGVTLINKGVTGLKGNTVPESQWSSLRRIHPPTINSP